jgi:hypothetical protein
VSFSSMFWFVPCAFFSTNNFAHAQTLYRMRSLYRLYECMNIVRVNIGFFTGFKKIKQRRISFVLCYLRMILWKISSAISIKHRILTTFNIKKKKIQLPLRIDCNFCSVHEEITSIRLYTPCNRHNGLRKGVYNLIEVISNEPNK